MRQGRYPKVLADQWVSVVYMQEWPEDAPEWGDRDAMAEYLAQWDYGDAADAGGEPYKLPTYVATEHVIGGLTYVLETSRHGDAALYRKALIDVCPVCGDPFDYCQGHGQIGDPVGFAILGRHEAGDHSDCLPGVCL